MTDIDTPAAAESAEHRQAHRLMLDEAALDTPCGFDGCNGIAHDAMDDRSAWRHEVVAESFDGGTVEAEISPYADGKPPVGSIQFEGASDMTAAEFRLAADEYEAFPAWLRSLADRMDALNA